MSRFHNISSISLPFVLLIFPFLEHDVIFQFLQTLFIRHFFAILFLCEKKFVRFKSNSSLVNKHSFPSFSKYWLAILWAILRSLLSLEEIIYMHPSKPSSILNFFVEKFGAQSGRKPRHHSINKKSSISSLIKRLQNQQRLC